VLVAFCSICSLSLLCARQTSQPGGRKLLAVALRSAIFSLLRPREVGKSYKANLDGPLALMGSLKNVNEFLELLGLVPVKYPTDGVIYR
jgi:hypothetical protein